jgi:hypothetical protein
LHRRRRSRKRRRKQKSKLKRKQPRKNVIANVKKLVLKALTLLRSGWKTLKRRSS